MSRYHSSWFIRVFGSYYFKSWAAECDAADPPFTQNTQATQGPRNTRGPLTPKDFFYFSFVLLFGQRLWKQEWSYIWMQYAVTLSM